MTGTTMVGLSVAEKPTQLQSDNFMTCSYTLKWGEEGGARWKGLHLTETRKTDEKWACGASLVAQWLRIHLPMQGTRVRALLREDPTCCRATKPMRHNY